MRIKILNETNPRVYAIILDTGQEVVSRLRNFAREHMLSASHLSAIGAFSSVTVGFWDPESHDYLKTRIDEQVEVLTLTGDIALKENEPKLHLHVVVGKRDATAYGGHLLEAEVRPTLEVIVTETPNYLTREVDQETGLALIRF